MVEVIAYCCPHVFCGVAPRYCSVPAAGREMHNYLCVPCATDPTTPAALPLPMRALRERLAGAEEIDIDAARAGSPWRSGPPETT